MMAFIKEMSKVVVSGVVGGCMVAIGINTIAVGLRIVADNAK